MLEVFVLGFWIIWSSNCDIYALSESLWFTLLAAVPHQLVDFSMPVIDQQWMMSNGALWLYVAVTFYLVNRLSSSSMATMPTASAASIGYYQLAAHLPDWISGLSAQTHPANIFLRSRFRLQYDYPAGKAADILTPEEKHGTDKTHHPLSRR